MNKGPALAILAEILPFDATSNGNAAIYVQQNGAEPAQLAQTEQVLLDALAKNPKEAGQLRWVLGNELYLQRMKDPAKVRQVFMDLIMQTPTNDGAVQPAFNWLLYNAATDADFQAVVTQYLKQRPLHYEWPSYRNLLTAWLTDAAQHKEQEAHAAWAKTQLAAADQDPLLKEWLLTENPDPNQSMPAHAG